MDSDRADKILKALEATEANFAKLQRIWAEIGEMIPKGVSFGSDTQYDQLRREFAEIVAVMPKVDGYVLRDSTLDLNTIAQWRFDAQEIDEIGAHLSAEEAIEQPEHDLREYGFRLRKKRRHLARELIQELVSEFDSELMILVAARPENSRDNEDAPTEPLKHLAEIVASLDRLLGTLSKRPDRWADLRRHLAFGMWLDVSDIHRLDWPTVRPVILDSLYGENDPLPVPVTDLDALEELPANTPIPTALAFSNLAAHDFERLVFALVSNEPGYENPQWLMRTNAPDRGRDVSVDRVTVDRLAGTRRERVIIQCKHWQETSVGVSELSTLKEQVKLWEPPRVGVLVIATTGRFTADAVLAVEKHNSESLPPRIEMWPDSHLELLLARRPGLIAEFGLRQHP